MKFSDPFHKQKDSVLFVVTATPGHTKKGVILLLWPLTKLANLFENTLAARNSRQKEQTKDTILFEKVAILLLRLLTKVAN